MVDDMARERAIYQALKAAGEVAAALQARLLEEHDAGPERAAAQSAFTTSLKLLRRARERLGQGLRVAGAGNIAEPAILADRAVRGSPSAGSDHRRAAERVYGLGRGPGPGSWRGFP
jgi:hypothetical protein